MEELRGWWEVPSIAHFCSLFRDAFGLLDFDIDDLEDAFLSSDSPQQSPLLFEIICRLLRGCYQRKDITYKNYEKYLSDIMKHRWKEEKGKINPLLPNAEGEVPSYWTLSMRSKVEILHALCDFRLDADDVVDMLKDFDTDVLRLGPIGYDGSGASYWYFYGTRLYKQDPESAAEDDTSPSKNQEQKAQDENKRPRSAPAKRGHESSGDDSEPETKAPPATRTRKTSPRLRQKEDHGDSGGSGSEDDDEGRKKPVVRLQKLVEVRKKSRTELDEDAQEEEKEKMELGDDLIKRKEDKCTSEGEDKDAHPYSRKPVVSDDEQESLADVKIKMNTPDDTSLTKEPTSDTASKSCESVKTKKKKVPTATLR